MQILGSAILFSDLIFVGRIVVFSDLILFLDLIFSDSYLKMIVDFVMGFAYV